MKLTSSSLFLGSLALCACSATSNPSRPDVSTSAPIETRASVATPTETTKPEPMTARDPEPATAESDMRDEVADASRPMPVAHVAGTDIDVRELLSQWLFHDSPGVHETLGELILARFSFAEAARLGMRIPDSELDLAYERGLEALSAEIERVSPGVPVDDYIERSRGLDPETFRARLKEQTSRALIAERVVRAWLLANDHVIARAIVTNSRAEMADVEALLKQGADFETVASEKSIDPSRERGGLLPPITRGEHSLARLAFVTQVGELGGPIEEQGRFMLIRVDERPRSKEGNWAEVGPAVERSLDRRPIDPMEWLQWEEAMYARYGVDTKPFLDLVGEPTERGRPR